MFTTRPRDAEARQLINEAKTIASIDEQVDNWHAEQPPMTTPPVIVERPIDADAQTGDSQLLGGPISIHAPWERQ